MKRTLRVWEREILLRLVEHARPDLDALALQIPGALAETRSDDVALFVEATKFVQRPHFTGLCSEAIYQDDDGRSVSLLLHVDDGLLFWLERLKLSQTRVMLQEPPMSRIERFVTPGSS